MNNITLTLEQNFRSFATNLNWLMNEAKDIDSAYFATDASSLVGALATSNDGASLLTKLTKNQYQTFIGFIEQINNFFGNSAVTTGDYLNTLDNVIYGNALVPAKLSDATEALATRMNALAQSCLSRFLEAKDILNQFNNSELSVIVGGCSGGLTVYGASMNVNELSQGITLVEQFKKMINNEAVSTGNYAATLAIWQMI